MKYANFCLKKWLGKLIVFGLLELLTVLFIYSQPASIPTIRIDSGRVFIDNLELTTKVDTTIVFEKIGAPTRVLWDPRYSFGALLWDPLGIGIVFQELRDKNRPISAYFYFRNLSSREGRKGKIGDGVGDKYRCRYSKRQQKRDLANHGQAFVEKQIEYTRDSVFPYTFQLINSILIDGEVLDSQTEIFELNERRSKKGLPPFKYYSLAHHFVDEYDDVLGKNKGGTYILLLGKYNEPSHLAIKLFYSKLGNLYYVIIEFPELA